MQDIINYKGSVDFLKEVIKLDRSEYSAQMQSRLESIRFDNISVPLILVSNGTAARIAGSEQTLQRITQYLSERKIRADISRIGCLGMINAEPVVAVQLPGKARIYFRSVTEDKVVLFLDDVFHNNIPEDLLIGQLPNRMHSEWKNIPNLSDTPFFKGQHRYVLKNCGISDPSSIEQYIAGGGFKAFIKAIRYYTHIEICDLIEQSGLRGRSGSGFLTGKKWKIALQTPSEKKYLICNAEESDPGAFMDRTIMEGDPFLLLEGICIAAYGVGASRAFICVRSEYTEAISQLKNAVRRLNDLGLLGHNIFESGYNLEIILWRGPGAFICGEETALINSLEGRRGMPQPKPPYPAVSGLNKSPTVINNVETLSNVSLIMANGPKWFTGTGVEGNYGTKLFAVTGSVICPGVVEVPMGTPLETIVYKMAGGTKPGKELKAVHIGGPAGCILTVDNLKTPLSFDSMRSVDAVLGGGGIVVIDEDTCILDMVKYYMDFMKVQSCGKCIPCREGTRRMSEILESITRKPVDEYGHTTLERFKGVMQLESIATAMKEASLCGLGQSAPIPVLSTLRYFREEYEEHIFDRKCRANVCTELRTYFIDVESCTGCSICAKKCPEDAIFGSPHHPYFIVEEKCTGCGICYDSCKFSAIYYK